MTNEICRVCEGSEDLEYIFDDDKKHVAKKLMACADVQVECNDVLPKYICSICCKNLEFVYDFKIQCEYTDRKLRKLCFVKEESSNNENASEICDYPEESQLFIEEPKEEEEYLLEEYENVEELIEEEVSIEEKEYGNEEIVLFDGVVEFNHENVESNDKIEEITQEGSVTLNESEGNVTLNESEGNVTLNESEKIESAPSNNHINKVTERKRGRKRKKHASTVLTYRIFSCDTCGQCFTRFLEFNAHKKSHGHHRFQCPTCMKWFRRRYGLEQHLKVHEQSEVSCDICGNKYSNERNLYRHVRIYHNNDKPYMCSECGVCFARSDNLKMHYSVHTTERNFECDICHKK